MNLPGGTELRQRLEGAAIVPLTLSLLQLSGDEQLLESLRPHVRGAWEHLAAVPPELAASIRERLACELERIAAGGAPACPVPPPELMQRMMAVAVGEAVHEEYIPMLLEHMRLEGLDAPPPTAATTKVGGVYRNQSVRLSVQLSVRLSVRLSVCPLFVSATPP